MPHLRVTRSPAARRDLKAIYNHIAQDNRPAAAAVLQRIDRDVSFLARHPFGGEAQPTLGEGIRRIIVRNYLVFYDVTTHVRILRVLHASQKWEDMF